MIKVKDVWEVIKPFRSKAETPVKSIDNKTASSEVIDYKTTFADRVKNVKVCIIIIGYCKLKALLRILYL